MRSAKLFAESDSVRVNLAFDCTFRVCAANAHLVLMLIAGDAFPGECLCACRINLLRIAQQVMMCFSFFFCSVEILIGKTILDCGVCAVARQEGRSSRVCSVAGCSVFAFKIWNARCVWSSSGRNSAQTRVRNTRFYLWLVF
jgi:hypothetical protein